MWVGAPWLAKGSSGALRTSGSASRDPVRGRGGSTIQHGLLRPRSRRPTTRPRVYVCAGDRVNRAPLGHHRPRGPLAPRTPLGGHGRRSPSGGPVVVGRRVPFLPGRARRVPRGGRARLGTGGADRGR